MWVCRSGSLTIEVHTTRGRESCQNRRMTATPNRRSFLRNLGGALAMPLTGAAARPNVLFIISDQFHHASYGAAGDPVVKTPNLDRLAHEGVRFEHAVCATPFCSPTRA